MSQQVNGGKPGARKRPSVRDRARSIAEPSPARASDVPEEGAASLSASGQEGGSASSGGPAHQGGFARPGSPGRPPLPTAEPLPELPLPDDPGFLGGAPSGKERPAGPASRPPRMPRPAPTPRVSRPVSPGGTAPRPRRPLVSPDAKRPEGPDRTNRTAKARTRRPLTVGRVVALVIGVLVAGLVAGGAYLGWNHWLRFDDAADIQGTWVARGTGVKVAFDASGRMDVGDEQVIYRYELDSFAKELTYRLEDQTARAHYRFSPDRRTLVLDEGSARDLLVEFGLKEDAQAASVTTDDMLTVLERADG